MAPRLRPRPRPSITLVVALLALTAGCSGAVTGPAGDGSDGSVTPAPVPTVSPSPDSGAEPTPAGTLAPGLSRTGELNASALEAAHERRLANASYTYRRVTSIRHDDGTVLRLVVTTARVGPRRTLVRRTVRDRGFVAERNRTEVRWANGTATFLWARNATATSYDRLSEPRSRPGDGDAVARYLGPQRVRVGAVQSVNGTRTYLLAARRPVVNVLIADRTFRRAGPGNVTAVVTRDGLVRSLHVRVDGTLRGRPVTITLRSSYSAVGRTTVGRPAWVGRAAAGGRSTPTPTPAAKTNATATATTGGTAASGARSIDCPQSVAREPSACPPVGPSGAGSDP